MSIFQTISFLFAAFMMYVVTVHYRKKLFSAAEFSAWISMWLVFIIISLFPNLLLGIVTVLHFDRVFDLLLVLAMMILTTILVMNYFSQKELKSQLVKYVRKDAIKAGSVKKVIKKKTK